MLEEAKRAFAAAFLKQLDPVLEWMDSVSDVIWEAYAEAEMPFGDSREGMWHWVRMMMGEEEEK